MFSCLPILLGTRRPVGVFFVFFGEARTLPFNFMSGYDSRESHLMGPPASHRRCWRHLVGDTSIVLRVRLKYTIKRIVGRCRPEATRYLNPLGDVDYRLPDSTVEKQRASRGVSCQ